MTSPHAAAALPRRAVLADVIPGARVRDACPVLSGALLTALFAQIAIDVPPSPVPITGQTLAVGLVARRSARAAAHRRWRCTSCSACSCRSTPTASRAGRDLGCQRRLHHRLHLRRGLRRLVRRARRRRSVGSVPRVRPRPAHHLRVRPRRAEDLGRRVVGWTIHNGFSIFIVGGLVKAAIGRCDAVGVATRAPVRQATSRVRVSALVANLAALWVASEVFDGMTYGDSFWTLVLAALVFTIVNCSSSRCSAILAIPFIISRSGSRTSP